MTTRFTRRVTRQLILHRRRAITPTKDRRVGQLSITNANHRRTSLLTATRQGRQTTRELRLRHTLTRQGLTATYALTRTSFTLTSSGLPRIHLSHRQLDSQRVRHSLTLSRFRRALTRVSVCNTHNIRLRQATVNRLSFFTLTNHHTRINTPSIRQRLPTSRPHYQRRHRHASHTFSRHTPA